MVGPYANIVFACEAYGTEGVEARNVMDESRANVDGLSLVWRTCATNVFDWRSGWMQEPSVCLSRENGEDFFLDTPSHRTH